jgi:hypothetical protein
MMPWSVTLEVSGILAMIEGAPGIIVTGTHQPGMLFRNPAQRSGTE